MFVSKHLIIAYTNGETEGLGADEIEFLDEYFETTNCAPMITHEDPDTVFERCALTGLMSDCWKILNN